MFNFFEKKDNQIQQDIVNELNWDPSLISDHISVSVKDGIATLRGSVPHFYEKLTAENAARRVGGVRAIADEIEVNLMGPYEKTDEEIAIAALESFKWSYSAPKNINVTVEKGWIILRGTATWEFQRNAARNCVSQLLGIRGVTNDIVLVPLVRSSNIKAGIKEALKRSAESEGNKIEVKVKGNQVILSGEVNSLAESKDAENVAWNAPNVGIVVNKLELHN